MHEFRHCAGTSWKPKIRKCLTSHPHFCNYSIIHSQQENLSETMRAITEEDINTNDPSEAFSTTSSCDDGCHQKDDGGLANQGQQEKEVEVAKK
jgi:hypothetical protein